MLIGRFFSLIRRADRRSGVGTLDRGQSDDVIDWQIPLTVMFVELALAGCAQGVAGRAIRTLFPGEQREHARQRRRGWWRRR
jgi:hypothetical protein